MKSILRTAIFCLLVLGMVANIAPHPASALAKAKRTFEPVSEAAVEQIHRAFIPMFYGTGNSSYTSSVQITNMEGTAATITITGFQEQSVLESINDTIAPNGTIDFTIPGDFFGAFVVSSDKQIEALVSINGSDFTTNATYLASSTGSNLIYLPVLSGNADGFTTWYSVQNTGFSPANVTVAYSDGLSSSAMIPVGAAHTFYQNAEGHADGTVFAGTITSDQPVVAAVVQQDGATLSAYIGQTEGTLSPPDDYDCSTVTQIPRSECEALVILYNSTDGPNWTHNNRWLETRFPCDWFGVGCSGGHVTELEFGRNGQGNGLRGDLPSAISNLAYLKQLDLSANQLDSIPDEIGALSSLIYLNLDENNLTALPSSLFNLSELETLSLHSNQLSCISDEIGNLSNLTSLDVNYNYITSANPTVLNFLAEMAPGWVANQNRNPSSSSVQSKPLYISTSRGGRVGGFSYNDEDVLVFDQCTNTWSLYFDGSDVGLRNRDVNALHVLDSGQILLSLNAPKTLKGVRYDDSDIIRFKPTSLGRRTRGTFHMYFDGSDVRLTTGGEDIDAITRLGNGDLVISTLGTARVTGATARDEDLLHFHKERLGANTKGTWSLYFDGSDIKLSRSSEDISAVWINNQWPGIYLSTYGNYSVAHSGSNQSGDSDDVFSCSPTGVGNNTKCDPLDRYWNGDDHGFGRAQIDGYSVGPTPPDEFINSVTGASVDDLDEEAEDVTEGQNDDVLDDDEYTEHIYLPLIAQ